MTAQAISDSWSRYWASAKKGCLPDAPKQVGAALGAVWRDFAKSLPKNADVLDLATGIGAVPDILCRARSDLKIIGVDRMQMDLKPAWGSILCGVDCAQLPFGDRSFDALTSQFGIEYCDPGALEEAARVLKPDGQLCLVVHDEAGLPVGQSRARSEAISDLMEAGLFSLARRVAHGLGEDRAVAAQIAKVRSHHQGQSIVDELPLALGQALRNGGGPSAIARIEAQARDELVRLRAMVAAAKSRAGIEAMMLHLDSFGLRTTRIQIAPDGVGPIAWCVHTP